MDVVFVFTAQEEVGTRGAFGAAFSVAPETALVLETTTAADLPGGGRDTAEVRTWQGPCDLLYGRGTIYDRGLFEDPRRLAEDNGIPWQTKEYIAGGQRRLTIQRSRPGCGWPPSPPLCAICTPRPAWAAWRILRTCSH